MPLGTDASESRQSDLGLECSELLCEVLRRFHALSKAPNLTDHQKRQIFQTRADVASVLLLSGYARPNGVDHRGKKVGLDVSCADPFRVHQYINQLHPVARASVRTAALPVKCSLQEHLEAKGRRALATDVRAVLPSGGPRRRVPK